MCLTFAEIASDQSPVQVGSWILIAGVVMAFILLSLQIFRLLFPQPPEWKSHIDAARREAREGDENLRQEIKSETGQLHGRVSKLRDEIRADYEKASQQSSAAAERTTAEVKGTMEKMLTIHTEAMSAISRLDGKQEATNQQLNATQQQLQRHIEKGSKE